MSPILRRYFSSAVDNRNPEIYGRAYVATDETTEYDKVLESLLKDRITARRNPLAQELEPTRHGEPNLTKAIAGFDASRPKEGQLQLITGRVGAGKSIFIRRYKELLQPSDAGTARHWAFVDFNTGPADLRTAEEWLCRAFVESFAEENPSVDIYRADALEHIFATELRQQRGIYASLNAISAQEAARRRVEDIAAWKNDVRRLSLGLCRYLGGNRREIVVVVMDNVDRRNLQDQLDAFQLALWFMKESRAFVILQLRDETYERFKGQPPLDTFRSGIGFHITPPRFVDIVKKRLDLSLDYLVSQTEDRLAYTLPNGMRMIYPNTRAGEFLKAKYLDLFHRKKNVSRVLQGLAGGDVRKALDMFVAILTSGHLSEDVITSQTYGAGAIAIPEYVILKILMRTEYRFFSDGAGFVTNLFSFEQQWENPNNFLLVEVLYYLTHNRRVRGQIGLEGYFSIEHLQDVLELLGFQRRDVLNACNFLLEGQLVEADHMNVDHVVGGDSIRVSPAGFIHLRILTERIEYLCGVLPVTPIFDADVSRRIADTLQIENQRGTVSAHQMVNCVRIFRSYLELQSQRIRHDFAEFGSDHSGTAYVLQQIQSAIDHFQSPAAAPRIPNLLDT